MLAKSQEYEQAELYMINNKHEKALVIIEALLETLRARESNKKAMPREFNSLTYIILMKKKYVCLIKATEAN